MLYRVSDVARELGVEESTIRKWIFQRRIPTVHLGRSVRIKPEDVESLIKKGTRPAVYEATEK